MKIGQKMHVDAMYQNAVSYVDSFERLARRVWKPEPVVLRPT
jgi:hypothetical protein